MADQWKASIREIAGVAVAMVDITVTRTIFLDPQTLEQVSGALVESGLSEARDFARAVGSVPAGMRHFVFTPWSDAETRRLNLASFSSIAMLFESRAYWRVDGTADTGFTGVLNLGGVERRIDLSEAALPAFLASVDATEQEAQQDFDLQKIKREEWDATKKMCDMMRSTRDECYESYQINLQMRLEKEAQKRAQLEQEQRDRERLIGDKVEYHGDFPDGFGEHFHDMA